MKIMEDHGPTETFRVAIPIILYLSVTHAEIYGRYMTNIHGLCMETGNFRNMEQNVSLGMESFSRPPGMGRALRAGHHEQQLSCVLTRKD